MSREPRPPSISSRKSLLAVGGAVQDIDTTAGTHVVTVDNAIWLLGAKSGLHLSNPELAEIARESGSPERRAEDLAALIRMWAHRQDGGEEQEPVDGLVDGLDREWISARKLFPEALKGRSW